MRGTLLDPVLGPSPTPEEAAHAVADLVGAVCGVAAEPVRIAERAAVLFPCRAGFDAAEVASAISMEQVTPAWVASDGRIAVAVGWGYGAYEQQQIVKAVAKVLHGLCEVHTQAINIIESASCPLPPRVAAWPWELAEPVLNWIAAAGAWLNGGQPTSPELTRALAELGEALYSSIG